MQGRKSNLKKHDLIELYINQQKTLEETAFLLNVSAGTVFNYLKKYNLPRREVGEVLLHNISNQKFGKWIITENYKIIKGHGRWLALCTICNQHHWVLNRTLTHGNSKGCQFCARQIKKEVIGEIWRSYWSQLQKGAKTRNLEFSITPEYAWDLFLKQNRKCPYSGIILTFGYKQNQTASMDRIDNKKGYIEGNVQWIHKTTNFMKHRLTEKEFLEWCEIIVNYTKNKTV